MNQSQGKEIKTYTFFTYGNPMDVRLDIGDNGSSRPEQLPEVRTSWKERFLRMFSDKNNSKTS